jgi:hypothetical protein
LATAFLLCAAAGCGGGVGALAGTYAGTWGSGGVDMGTWTAVVGGDGAVSGSGTRYNGSFTIGGKVVPSGQITFGATEREIKTATFTGMITQGGDVTGTWEEVDGSPNGTFTGKRS